LRRFHRLHGTLRAVQEYTFTVRFISQSKTIAFGPQSRVALYKVVLGQIKKASERGDLVVSHSNETWPAAAITAALAEIMNGRVFHWSTGAE
jgi:hypothetical protein